MKTKNIVFVVILIMLSINTYAEIEKSNIQIIQVNPYFYLGKVQIDITASNNGTLDGNVLIKFVLNEEEKTELFTIPANNIRKYTYTIQDPQEGTLEVYVLSDENRSCLINIDPKNELIDMECVKDDLSKTKKIEKKDVLEEYFGREWPILFIGVIILSIVAFIAYKFFSREKTEIEKQLESGRKLLKELSHLEAWRKKKEGIEQPKRGLFNIGKKGEKEEN